MDPYRQIFQILDPNRQRVHEVQLQLNFLRIRIWNPVKSCDLNLEVFSQISFQFPSLSFTCFSSSDPEKIISKFSQYCDIFADTSIVWIQREHLFLQFYRVFVCYRSFGVSFWFLYIKITYIEIFLTFNCSFLLQICVLFTFCFILLLSRKLCTCEILSNKDFCCCSIN